MRAAYLEMIETIMEEGQYTGQTVWAAGGAAAKWVKENLPENPLGDILMHAQNDSRRRQLPGRQGRLRVRRD